MANPISLSPISLSITLSNDELHYWLLPLHEGAIQSVLSRYLGDEDGGRPIKVSREQSGKPILPEHPDFHFNYSHTKDTILIAVTKIGPIGVDLERSDRKVQWRPIAERFYSPEEAKALESMNDRLARHEFLKKWCIKESAVKATGDGLLKGFQKMKEGHEELLWSRSLRVPSGFIAAASIVGQGPKPQNLKFIDQPGDPSQNTVR